MFGLFKEQVSAEAVAKMAMISATQFPSEMQERVKPLNFKVDELFVSETFALAFTVTILGIQRSSFSAADAHRVCAEFSGLYSDFIARQLTKGTGNSSAATGMLLKFFQDRYTEYKADATETAIASKFLRCLGQREIHPTTKTVISAMVYAGLLVITDNMKKISRKAKLR